MNSVKTTAEDAMSAYFWALVCLAFMFIYSAVVFFRWKKCGPLEKGRAVVALVGGCFGLWYMLTRTHLRNLW